jgi:hypothetical protein
MKTTYFFGAGASANVIPTMIGIEKGLKNVSGVLEQLINAQTKEGWDTRIVENIEILNSLKVEFDEITKQLTWHQTIDTVARKYYLQSNWAKYNKLKIVLSTFFAFGQLVELPDNENVRELRLAQANSLNFRIDKRYDSLFSNILQKQNNSIEALDNISIITWNYDLQIELALRNFFPHEPSITELKERFSILNGFNINQTEEFDFNKFSVIKLNGDAYFEGDGIGNDFYSRLFEKLSTFGKITADYFFAEISEILKKIDFNNIGKDETGLSVLRNFSYSWELDFDNQVSFNKRKLIDNAKVLLENTEKLIIVGYSFPDANVSIDREIFKNSYFKEVVMQNWDNEITNKFLNSIYEKPIKTESNLTANGTRLVKNLPTTFFPSFM